MGNSETWAEFSHKANLLVRGGQPINTFQSHIQVLFEPSFDDHVHLQLNWVGSNVKWYKTTWNRSTDSIKFDPIENLKYIGAEVRPSIKYENGESDTSKVKNILELVQNVSVKPRIVGLGTITLDGCYYTLTLGVEDFETVYKWHSPSEGWKDLQYIADMLFNLNLDDKTVK